MHSCLPIMASAIANIAFPSMISTRNLMDVCCDQLNHLAFLYTTFSRVLYHNAMVIH
jgi:hypothetical protein